jgi:hypothetical protein
MKRKTDRKSKPPREARAFAIYDQGGMAMVWYCAYYRKQAISQFERDRETTWPKAEADGYRCVRVRMVPEGAAPAWDWRKIGPLVWVGVCGDYTALVRWVWGEGPLRWHWEVGDKDGKWSSGSAIMHEPTEFDAAAAKARAACEAALAAHLARKGGKR